MKKREKTHIINICKIPDLNDTEAERKRFSLSSFANHPYETIRNVDFNFVDRRTKRELWLREPATVVILQTALEMLQMNDFQFFASLH